MNFQMRVITAPFARIETWCCRMSIDLDYYLRTPKKSDAVRIGALHKTVDGIGRCMGRLEVGKLNQARCPLGWKKVI